MSKSLKELLSKENPEGKPKYQLRVDLAIEAHSEWLNLKLSDREYDRTLQAIYAPTKKEKAK